MKRDNATWLGKRLPDDKLVLGATGSAHRLAKALTAAFGAEGFVPSAFTFLRLIVILMERR
jgi:hypothetical protein